VALTDFQGNYTIQHAVSNPDVVSIDQNDSIEIVFVSHPITGNPVLHSFVITPITSPHVSTWKNATNLAYDAVHDQITGTIWNQGPLDINNNPTYVERTFCMSLDGDPTLRVQRLHCYVGPGSSGNDPDDGSWAGDVD
jgi:hypothetical protein